MAAHRACSRPSGARWRGRIWEPCRISYHQDTKALRKYFSMIFLGGLVPCWFSFFTNANTRRMRVEMLRVGQRNNCRRIGCQSIRFISHDTAAFEEFVDADAAGEARGSVRRQAVTRSGNVIASSNGRIWSDEDRTRIRKLRQDACGFANLN